MVPVKQLFRHKPPHTYGDCHRTAIACILNMRPQDVPHFMDGKPDNAPAPEASEHVAFWLARRGITQINIVYDGSMSLHDLLHTVHVCNPGIACILGGKSRTGVNHSVVILNGEIACDPSLTDAGIVGPCDDGRWWVTYFGALVTKCR